MAEVKFENIVKEFEDANKGKVLAVNDAKVNDANFVVHDKEFF